MLPHKKTLLPILLLLLLALLASKFRASMSFIVVGFYAATCPDAEAIVNGTVRLAFEGDPDAPAKLLRLSFHDCFVEGCDASILLDSTNQTTAEKDDPANSSVDGFDIIDAAKAMVENVCPGVVSCADIVALAARDAVALMGGPSWAVPTGRLDGRVSLAANVRTNLPDTTFNLTQLVAFFAAKGLTLADMITLSGAHTVGRAHCSAFNDRFSVVNDTLVLTDPTLTPEFAEALVERCPATAASNITIPLDMTTATVFDNVYFQNLEAGRGLMHSDEALFFDPQSKTLVDLFASDQDIFFENWQISMVKLSGVGVKAGPKGEVRKDCRRVN